MTLLDVSGLGVSYGGLHALSDVSLDVAGGEFVTIVGPNGAGKTTLLKAIAGVVPAAAGRIAYGSTDVARWPAHVRARRGIAHVPEGRKVFSSMTVLENLEMGSFRAVARSQRAETLETVYALFPVLRERRTQLAGSLSGGEQQMLAIGRALMGNPRVLLMDEPSEGLAPQLVAEVGRTIAQLKAEGQSILLVEQNIKLTLDLADDVVIINTGAVVFKGQASSIKLDDQIVSQHLGIF